MSFFLELRQFRLVTFTLRLLGSLILIGLTTFACFGLFEVNETTASLAYLLCILAIGAAWGLLEAISASIAATLCFNYYFLPPVRTLRISDPQNWVALFAFLFTAALASQLADHAKRRADETHRRQMEMEKLYSLGRAILLIETTAPPARGIIHQTARIFGFSAVVLYDRSSGAVYQAGPEDMPDMNAQLQEAALQGTRFVNEKLGVTVTAIQLGGQPIGGMAIRGSSLSDTALQSLSNLVAVGLEKARSQDAANRAEAARQSQELKSTLLDAIAHEFKTPLTSIKAASTSLLSPGSHPPEENYELMTIINEEADRLSRLVTEAIEMARVEGGELKLNRSEIALRSLIQETLSQLRPMNEGRQVNVECSEDLPLADVDVELMELALRQIADNALKYSPASAEITVKAQTANGRMVLSVLDRGPGIAKADRRRVFEKFYRGAGDRSHVTGSGMGLAIAQEIVKAHGGAIVVKDNPGGGADFSILLPLNNAKHSR
jgi:two-component system, OmpR family, sensor histidine kinase KdpD